MTRFTGPALILGAVAFASAGACGGDESVVSPLPVEAGADASHPPPQLDAAAPEAQAVKRTIIQRNPYGDVAASNNVLWDGDFEWDTAFADEYGWAGAVVTFQPIGTWTQIRIGYECHSGMKCAWIAPGQKIGAIGVSPGDVPVEASVWVKPPSSECIDVDVSLFGCTDTTDADVALSDDDGKTDADGWCFFHAVGDPRKTATCLIISAQFPDNEALVDDAVVRSAAVGTMSARALHSPTTRSRQAIVEMRSQLAGWLKPREPQPTAAERAYVRWRRGAR